MSTFALIPVKRLSEAKVRLSTILKPEERKDFTLAMLMDVLKAVFSSSISRTVIVSSDRNVRSISLKREVTFFPDTGDELNSVLNQATEWCIRRGAEEVLILPTDVPLITCQDIEEMISLNSDGGSVTISPSYSGGTNALIRRPPDIIPTCFGNQSFKKHIDEASKIGVKIKIYRSPRVSLDIDSPRDLIQFLKIESETETSRFLRERGIDKRLKNLYHSGFR